MTADGDGAGEKDLVLDEGCHRIDLLGPTLATSARPPDIDAMIVDRATSAPLASDRTESADATLELCVGHRAAVQLHFAGAPAREQRSRCCTRARRCRLDCRSTGGRRLADTWRRLCAPTACARSAALRSTTHWVSCGVTALPVRVEPGACYVAAVAALRGDEQGLALAASAGTEDHQNQTDASGTALAFCARASTTALIEIDARGHGLVWLFALWQTGRVPIGGASL